MSRVTIAFRSTSDIAKLLLGANGAGHKKPKTRKWFTVKLSEHIDYAFNSLRYRSLRSWLTILGIVIGIASIVILISLAQGLDTSIRDQLKVYGSNYLAVIPGQVGGASGYASLSSFAFQGALYDSDVAEVRRVPGIKSAGGVVAILDGHLSYRGQPASQMISGVDPGVYADFLASSTAKLQSGRWLKNSDRGKIVIGDTVAKTRFKTRKNSNEVRLNDIITINGRDFRVVGIFAKVGSFIASTDFDEAIYMNIEDARDISGATGADRQRVYSIFAVTENGVDPRTVADDIKLRLANKRHVPLDDLDFSIFTADQILNLVGSITSILALFMAGVAAISLLVGGMGVANSMFTSVLERTREIGILKSVGASNADIQNIFLFESGIIGAVGGIIGAVTGWLFAAIFSAFGIPTTVSPELLLFAVAFSFAVGMVSGYFPARNAARLQPVEALRYE